MSKTKHKRRPINGVDFARMWLPDGDEYMNFDYPIFDRVRTIHSLVRWNRDRKLDVFGGRERNTIDAKFAAACDKFGIKRPAFLRIRRGSN